MRAPTIYRIERNGEVVFRNENTACFREIFLENIPERLKDLSKEEFDQRELVFCVEDSLELKDIKLFLARVKTFGVFAKVEEAVDFDTPKAKGVKYQIRINYKRHKTPNFLKFAIMVCRLLIEEPSLIPKYLEYKDLDDWGSLWASCVIHKTWHTLAQSSLYNYKSFKYFLYSPKSKKQLRKSVNSALFSDMTRSLSLLIDIPLTVEEFVKFEGQSQENKLNFYSRVAKGENVSILTQFVS